VAWPKTVADVNLLSWHRSLGPWRRNTVTYCNGAHLDGDRYPVAVSCRRISSGKPGAKNPVKAPFHWRTFRPQVSRPQISWSAGGVDRSGGEVPVMTKQAEACSSSPAAMLYWFIASLVAWGALSLIGIYWHPLHASSAVACLFAMGIGCVANWLRNRSFHCTMAAPIFLIAGIVFLLSSSVLKK
jgi:hypothetical protein